MKLYEIPNGSKIHESCSDGSTFFTFHRIDGSYSTCTTEKGALVHLRASCPLVAHEDGYKFESTAPVAPVQEQP